MSTLAIEADAIRYSYGETHAVDGISFTVGRGEVVGFLGPNGAGKSTTVKLLTGMLRPDSGTISMLGYDVTRERARVHERMGVCFEEKNLYVEMTARENLDFFARLFGIRGYDCRALLRRVGLESRMDDRVKRYSKGMRQRLMVARALVNTPDVLFLDEPTDGLDPVSARAIRSVITEEAQRGAAVFLTTHDMNEADQLSDRVAFINDGRVVAFDTPENLKLEHGSRSVKVRMRGDDGVEERVVALGGGGAGELLRTVADDPRLMTIHTEEASLEDIFVKLTGRGLV
ncbi:MAG: ABC transporter ATP-binding protein [Spirochaetota bacterium]